MHFIIVGHIWGVQNTWRKNLLHGPTLKKNFPESAPYEVKLFWSNLMKNSMVVYDINIPPTNIIIRPWIFSKTYLIKDIAYEVT